MDTFFIFVAKYLFAISVLILGWKLWTSVNRKRLSFFAFFSLVLTYAFGKIASLLYYNPRPFVVNHFEPLIRHAADNGFPSDHMLLVAGLASVGAYIDRKLSILLWIIAILVGSSRIYVGVHHPLDIWASIVIAIISTNLVYLYFHKRKMI